MDPRVGVAHCVTPETVRQALHEVVSVQDRTAVGVLIVSPTYFGAVADVEGMSQWGSTSYAVDILDSPWAAKKTRVQP